MKGDFTRLTFRPERHYSAVLAQQGRGSLDADANEQSGITRNRIEVEATDVIGACGAPAAAPGFSLTPSGGGLTIGAGRFYVDGILCVNEQDVDLAAQADLPGVDPPTEPGAYLAYLDVWDRHLTATERPEIREVALGGPDTATRVQTVWQVRLVGIRQDNPTCASALEEWKPLTVGSAARLTAQASRAEDPTTPCVIPPGAGYRRLENQLYRVEIHDAGDLDGKATFVWSRDNGSVVTRWLGKSGNDLTVTGVGRDDVLGFAGEQWVELIDDRRELTGAPGTLVQLEKAEGQVLRIKPATATGTVDLADFPLNPRIRRWDGTARVEAPAVELEDGVFVTLSGGPFATGDYWTIPARTATGDLEWPSNGGGPQPQPPAGIDHHRCRLALVRLGERGWELIEDCRKIFPPLTEVVGGGEEPGVHVLEVRAPDRQLGNDGPLSIEELAAGIDIVCDQNIDPRTLAGKPTCLVTLDLPFPTTDDDLEAWIADGPVGTIPLTLGADVVARRRIIQWRPAPATRSWLAERVPKVMERLDVEKLLIHLTLKGNFISVRNNPATNLDGEAFGFVLDAQLDVSLPSGDRRRGGDLEMWFWLTRRPSALDAVLLKPVLRSTVLDSPERREGFARVVSLAVDRERLREAVPDHYALDAGAELNPDAARELFSNVGLDAGPMIRVRADPDLVDAVSAIHQLLISESIFLELPTRPLGDDPVRDVREASAQGAIDFVLCGRATAQRLDSELSSLFRPGETLAL